ncbi:MAG: hypothetical protein AAGC77_01845 [Pseudomonadota bacterium]
MPRIAPVSEPRRAFGRLRRRIADIEKRTFRGPAPIAAPVEHGTIGPMRLAPRAIHELRVGDYRDAPAALGLGLVLASVMAARSHKPLIWIGATRDAFQAGFPYGCGLSVYGVNLDQTLFVHARDQKSLLWAAEEAAQNASIVLCEFWKPHPLLNLTATRRLQLAAQSTGANVLLLRDARDETPSAARTRWRIEAAQSAPDPLDEKGLGRPRWAATLEKCRDGGRGRWVLEWDHDKRELKEAAPHPRRVVSPLVYGSSQKTAASA